MTIQELAVLSEEERDLVLTAPAMITVLIAGADDDFDKREENRAKKAVHFRQIQGDPLLFDYFKSVEVSFMSSLQHMIQKYEGDHDRRGSEISEQLAELNNILPKIEARYAKALIENWRNMAKAIAHSSGGVLGYVTISDKEAEFIGLDMITYKP